MTGRIRDTDRPLDSSASTPATSLVRSAGAEAGANTPTFEERRRGGGFRIIVSNSRRSVSSGLGSRPAGHNILLCFRRFIENGIAILLCRHLMKIRTVMIAILPPVYFPGLEYSAIMASVDRIVLADRLQYSRQSRQNRARLRMPGASQWISIPLRGGQYGSSIRDIRIDYTQYWAGKHKKALLYNYGKAPYYEHYISTILDTIGSGAEFLGAITVESVAATHRLLGLGSEVVTGGNAQRIIDRLNKSPDSEELLVSARDDLSGLNAGYRYRIMKYAHPVYRQQFPGFEAGMSAIDLLFSCGPETADILRRGLSTDIEPF